MPESPPLLWAIDARSLSSQKFGKFQFIDPAELFGFSAEISTTHSNDSPHTWTKSNLPLEDISRRNYSFSGTPFKSKDSKFSSIPYDCNIISSSNF